MNGLLQHHRESTEYLMPAHIIQQARKAKRERLRQEKRTETLALTERTAPPPNFREMIEEATGSPAYRVHPETGEIDLRRIQAQMEIKRLTGDLGAMP